MTNKERELIEARARQIYDDAEYALSAEEFPDEVRCIAEGSAQMARAMAAFCAWLLYNGQEQDAPRALQIAEMGYASLIESRLLPGALHSRDVKRKLDQGRAQRSADASFEAQRRHEEWQRLADEIWSRRPTLSKEAVARHIKNSDPGITAKTPTIAKKIRRKK